MDQTLNIDGMLPPRNLSMDRKSFRGYQMRIIQHVMSGTLVVHIPPVVRWAGTDPIRSVSSRILV